MARFRRFRTTATALAAVLAVGGTTAATSSAAEPPDKLVYFVHGYADSEKLDCDALWGDAMDYFEKRGKDRDSLRTIAYYDDDENCDVKLGHGNTDTRIKYIAADLANEIYDEHTSKGESVDIVAHSMGGLVGRLAMLGSAKGCEGFPDAKLKVDDVVTLSTPHQGVEDKDRYDSVQWETMVPGSRFLKMLHRPENGLSQGWAAGTDWTFVGSDEDRTVSGDSAIDKGYHADHKHRYLRDEDHDVSHVNIRKLAPGGRNFNVRHGHHGEGEVHETANGWAPLGIAYNALSRGTDW